MEIALKKAGCFEALSDKPGRMSQSEYDKKEINARDKIVQSLEDRVIDIIRGEETAQGIMNKLKETYIRKGISVQVHLQRKLRNLVFDGRGSLNAFLEEFDKTVQELRSSGGSMDEMELIPQLLSAMPKSYQSVVSSVNVLFSKDPEELTLAFVRNQLLEHERQSKDWGSQLRRSEVETAFVSQRTIQKSQRSYPEQVKKKTVCRYRCFSCGKRGHLKRDCPEKKGGQDQANCAQGEDPITFVAEVESQRRIPELPQEGDMMSMTACHDGIMFVIDSGASHHMVNKNVAKFLRDTRPVNLEIRVAKKGESLTTARCGKLALFSNDGLSVNLEDVYECDNISYNLLSVGKIQKQGFCVSFEDDAVEIKKNGRVLLKGTKTGNLYILHLFRDQRRGDACVTSDPELRHRRMGHSSLHPPLSMCEVCQKGKQVRNDFKSLVESKKPKRILECVSSDVVGPISPPSIDGKRYLVTFIDNYSRFCVCYLLGSKDEVLSKFKLYEAMVTAKHGQKIERLRCDRGGEYTGHNFLRFCQDKGIQIEFSATKNPEQNGICEKYNQHLMNMVRCLLFDSKVSKQLWGQAVLTAVFTINRLETSALPKGKTPAEIWNGQKPDFGKLRVFGCKAYSLIPKENRGKLDEKCKVMIMAGYSANGYQLYDPDRNEIVHARNVRFSEDERLEANIPTIDLSSEDDADENNDEDTSANQAELYSQHETLEAFDATFALASCSSDEDVPSTYEEAVRSDSGWRKAIQDELSMIEKKEVWDVVPKPENETIIDSKWVFTKKEADGSIVRKARLVARGFLQGGVEEEVYSPVARMITLRTLLTYALNLELDVHQMDVKSAFLNGKLDAPVYMIPPKGKMSCLVVRSIRLFRRNVASSNSLKLLRQYARLIEVGKLESPRSTDYETGQLFLHKIFSYRGVVLFPWVARVYDRDSPVPRPSDRVAEDGAPDGKEIKGKSHTFYQVLIDTRDCPHIRAQTEAVTFLGNQEGSRSLYAIPGLDYVAHDDIVPYKSADKNPIQHELFDKFLLYNSKSDPPFVPHDTLKAWQKKNHPWLELSDVHKETTENVRITVIPFYMGSRDNQSSLVYWWRYCIRIENLGETSVQLRERHWRIFSLSGTLETVRGRGVVGQEPVLSKESPAFQYSSHVSLQAPSGHMWGTFRMEREDGYTFDCRIPPFSLESKSDEENPNPPSVSP
ncbi:Protein of unknown function (DUF525) [Nesidiocoris tenuis]|uniref:Endonuclease n=1 Tax=Nesidiocoris tenuis TaxID=355587 RepID=A0ABN7AHT9_9HEMI|nr:Protein of unknown function (DUF525) [Nesidiocoris tenuis]